MSGHTHSAKAFRTPQLSLSGSTNSALTPFQASQIPSSVVVTSNILDLIESLNLDKWMAVNPRVPNRNAKDVPTGYVIKGIWETLQNSPKRMAIKCQGMFLLVESVEHERKQGGRGELRLTLTNSECHGLANGGHTYAAIWEFAERNGLEGLEDAYVRLHVFPGDRTRQGPGHGRGFEPQQTG